VLNLAGVYLGPEEELLNGDLRHLAGEGKAVLARAREANPGGFWEHYRIMRLNERILREQGGNWREPPELQPGWERSDRLAAERQEARAMLEQSFDGHRLWGWKDPRMSLTLPFCQSLAPVMLHVICVRNPADVAESLRRRDGISFEDGIALWLRYMTAALVHTSSRPRLLVPFEGYFGESRVLLERLARFASGGGTRYDAEGLPAAINLGLWRNRSSPEEAVAHPRMPSDAASLYLSLRELLASLPNGGPAGGDPSLEAGVDAHARKLSGAREGLERG